MWQPIETAPKDRVLLLFSPRDGVCLGKWFEQKFKRWKEVNDKTQKLIGVDDYSGWNAANGNGVDIYGATHWHPLPEPPEPTP